MFTKVKRSFPLPQFSKIPLVPSLESFSTNTKATSSNRPAIKSILLNTLAMDSAQSLAHPVKMAFLSVFMSGSQGGKSRFRQYYDTQRGGGGEPIARNAPARFNASRAYLPIDESA